MNRHRIPGPSALLSVLLSTALLLGACDSTTTIEIGAIRVTVTTIGDNFDPDGYTVHVVGENVDQSQAVEVNDEVLFGLPSGDYVVELLDKAPNCVSDLNPQGARVTAGNTTDVLINNLCV